MDDDRIIELFFKRSEQAIVELSGKYGSVCSRIAQNILNDQLDSEECVNDAYLVVWNSIPPQRPDSLAGYVCSIVRNIALNKYHRNTAKKRNSIYDVALEEIAEYLPSGSYVEDDIQAKGLSECINGFLDALDRQDRIMFVRRYWYSDSMDELSELFHVSKHYISVRLSRIRKALRKHLIQEGYLYE